MSEHSHRDISLTQIEFLQTTDQGTGGDREGDGRDMAVIGNGSDSDPGEQCVEAGVGPLLQQSFQVAKIGAGNIQGSSRPRRVGGFV